MSGSPPHLFSIPAVNTDNMAHDSLLPHYRRDRDRDGFQFDTLSHGSSHSSVQLGLGGMGTVVDMVHTPLQGSVDNFSDLLETPDTARREEIRAQHSSDLQRPTSSLSAVSSSSSQVTAQHPWSPGHQTQARSPESQHQPKEAETYDKYDTASISSLPSYNQVSEMQGSLWGAA